MNRMQVSVLLAAVLLAAPTAFGQLGAKKTPDQRVEKLLQEAELKYKIDEDADFVLGNKIDEERTQLAWILSNTHRLGTLEIRHIWSIAYRSREPIPPKIAARLLEENGQVKVGAWQIRKMGQNYVAVFAAQIAADADKQTLLLVLHAVTSTADEMEKELTGKDDF